MEEEMDEYCYCAECGLVREGEEDKCIICGCIIWIGEQ